MESLRLEKTDCADIQFPATLRHRETCKRMDAALIMGGQMVRRDEESYEGNKEINLRNKKEEHTCRAQQF